MAKKLYGTISHSMNEYEKIRTRLIARMVELWDDQMTIDVQSHQIASALVRAGYTDQKLQSVHGSSNWMDVMIDAFGRVNMTASLTVEEAYGDRDVPS